MSVKDLVQFLVPSDAERSTLIIVVTLGLAVGTAAAERANETLRRSSFWSGERYWW